MIKFPWYVLTYQRNLIKCGKNIHSGKHNSTYVLLLIFHYQHASELRPTTAEQVWGVWKREGSLPAARNGGPGLPYYRCTCQQCKREDCQNCEVIRDKSESVCRY